ncbi:hypothetical protein RJZ90_005784 [Blastomyces dermatitidis]
MVPVHCNRTLTEVVTGDRDQTQLDTEKPVRKLAAKRKQSKSSKNRNKRKAKKEAAEYQKSMEELAASTATALIEHSHISRQGYRYEPFIVGSTQPQPASQWQFGQGSFNSQYTADTAPLVIVLLQTPPYHLVEFLWERRVDWFLELQHLIPT